MVNMFLHGCSDHQDQLFCLSIVELKELPWPYEQSLGSKRVFRWGLLACYVFSSVVRRGQEMFCGCCRFGFVFRVIYSTAVFIKSVF